MVPADISEHPLDGETPADFAERAARDKVLAVAVSRTQDIVLGADTVVELGGRILGKPKTPAEAVEMLNRLSGATHAVHTGLALAARRRCSSLVDTTKVRFAPLSREQAAWYAATGEPMDKAGAYAIQEIGGLFVAGITGSPHTVVGLPIHRLPELFETLGLRFWERLSPRVVI